MSSDTRRIWSASVVLALLATAAAGCAQDVGDIDKTQPDKIDKSIFENNDEWYYTQTVVDTDSQGTVPLAAFESGLKRIRWEVNQRTLFAYSTVEPAKGINKGEQAEDSEKLGAVAAFPIQSHFDVQRAYSPQTGNPSNVITENYTDRSWYERDYMRVAWEGQRMSSQTVPQLLRSGGIFGSGIFTNVRAVPQKEGEVSPYRARIGEDYIEITLQYTFQPNPRLCARQLSYAASQNCDGGKVRVRHSFKRLEDEEKRDDYEPLVYNPTRKLYPNGDKTEGALTTQRLFDQDTGYQMQVRCNRKVDEYVRNQFGQTSEQCHPATFEYNMRFGYFRSLRVNYNDKRPFQDPAKRYYAKRWDIWQDMDEQLEDKIGGGIDQLNGNKAPKRIVYHLNAQYPKNMISTAKEVQEAWDRTMKEAVALKGGYAKNGTVTNEDLQKVGEDLETIYGNEHMFLIKRNSCHPGPLANWKEAYGNARSADRREVGRIFSSAIEGVSGSSLEQKLWNMPTQQRVDLCAELTWATKPRGKEKARFTWERMGDVHHSFFTWIRDYNFGWLGYGPAAADPLTGEIVSADANFAGRLLGRYVSTATDKVRYMTGDLSTSDVQYGRHVEQYLNRLQAERKQKLQQGLEPGELPEHAERELAERSGYNPKEISPTDFEERPPLEQQPDIVKQLGYEELLEKFDRLSRKAERAKKVDTRWTEFYEHPKIKSALMKDSKFQTLIKSMAASRFGPKNVDKDALHQSYLDLMSPHRTRQRQQEIQKWMAERNMYSGETVQESIDGVVTLRGAEEFFEDKSREEIRDYFRKHLFLSTQLHEVGHTVGLRHNYSASMDAMNYHDEYWKIQRKVINGEIDETEKYRLTGDIAKEVTGDEDTKYANAAEYKNASIMEYMAGLTSDFGGLGKYDQAAINFAYAERVQTWQDDIQLPDRLRVELLIGDYRDIPEILGEAAFGANASEKSSREIKNKGIDILLDGRKWAKVDEVVERKRQRIQRNTRQWEQNEFGPENEPKNERVISYNYCSDRSAGLTLGCQTFDRGANHTEIVNFAFNEYRFMQPFWRYRGQDIDNMYTLSRSYLGEVLQTFNMAEEPFRYFAYSRFTDLGAYTEDLKRASLDSLNFFAEIMAMPEPGRYCRYEDETVSRDENWYRTLGNSYVPAGWHALDGKCPNQVTVPRGPGQFYGYKISEQWSPLTEYGQIQRVGSYIDKLVASSKFFRISGNFINSTFVTDTRATKLSFWSIFRDELIDWLGAIIMDDFTGFAGHWNAENGRYEPPKLVDPQTFGEDEEGSNDQGSPLADQENMPPIRTRSSFSQQLNTIAGALLADTSWRDRAVDTRKYLKVNIYDGEIPKYGEGTTKKEFVHPVTNVTYMAPQTSDKKSISADLIEWANELKSDWNESKKRLESDELQPGTEEYNRVEEEVDLRLNQLEEVVAKLNMLRDINKIADTQAN